MDEAALGAMSRQMRRRGMGPGKVWSAGPVGLGHGAVLGGLAIDADVRLDNAGDLLSRLDLRPDEVPDHATLVLHAYRRWGRDAVPLLLGDFAFVLWDADQRLLLCARDALGVRSLSYAVDRARVIVASDASVVASAAGLLGAIDPGRVADYLLGGFFECSDPTNTFYRGVLRLPAGHWLAVTEEDVTVRRYWWPDVNTGLRFRSDGDRREHVRDLLTEAVACRLRDVARPAAMLSGGIDSSSIVALAPRPLVTLSGISDDEGCHETALIRQVADHVGTSAVYIRPSELERFVPAVRDLASTCEEPFDFGMHDIQFLAWAEARARGIDVVLDGIDGDLIFGKGEGLSEALLQGRARAAWKAASGRARWSGETPLQVLWRFGLESLLRETALETRAGRALRQWRGRAGVPRYQPSSANGFIHPDLIRQVDVPGRLRHTLEQIRPAPLIRSSADEVQRALICSSFLQAGVERYDRTAAHQSVEARHPLLDRRVVEFCVGSSWADLESEGWPKSLLRRSMEGVLPHPVCWRRWAPALHEPFRDRLFQLNVAWLRGVLEYTRNHVAPFVDVACLEAQIRHADSQETWPVDTRESLGVVAALGLFMARARGSPPDYGPRN